MAGTPIYLAPELFDGRPATRTSDVYSLGVLLYRLVTRAYPVDGADRGEIEEAHRRGRVKLLRDVRPDLPSGFVTAIERALSPNPNDRPQTAGTFEAMLAGATRSSDWWRYAAAAAAAVAVAIGIPLYLMMGRGDGQNQTNVPSTQAVSTPTANAPPPPAATVPTYSVRAVLVREQNGVETPVTSRMTLKGGDHLGMIVEASRSVYVYVLNADDAGKSYRLFPLPEHRLDNPLAPSQTHRLPSANDNWTVTSEGGQEHFVVMVSPTKDDAIDAIVRGIPGVANARTPERVAIPTRSIGVLRSVGGLSSRTPNERAPQQSMLWFDGAGELTGQAEQTSGTWIRRLTVPGRTR